MYNTATYSMDFPQYVYYTQYTDAIQGVLEKNILKGYC